MRGQRDYEGLEEQAWAAVRSWGFWEELQAWLEWDQKQRGAVMDRR